MKYECDWCESDKVNLLRVTRHGGTRNRHLKCRDCGIVWTIATFLSPVVKKDTAVKGGAA